MSVLERPRRLQVDDDDDDNHVVGWYENVGPREQVLASALGVDHKRVQEMARVVAQTNKGREWGDDSSHNNDDNEIVAADSNTVEEAGAANRSGGGDGD